MMHLNAQFEKCDALLMKHLSWWQFRAFHYKDYPWQIPELHQALDYLSDDDVGRLQSDEQALAQFLLPWLSDSEALLSCVVLPGGDQSMIPLSPSQQNAIPGKKFKQISAFAQALPEAAHVLEWCAGKGHLGRILAARGAMVTAIEINPELCAQGQKLGAKAAVQLEYVCADVLRDNLSAAFMNKPYAVALHACGDLHQQLIQLHGETSGLSVVPCCYHLTKDECYQPLSQQAQQSALQLSKQDLSLCLQETVTACQKMPEMNNQEVKWRMAFDSLQRDLLGKEQYLPLPAMKKSQLKQSFEAFIEWALTQKQINKPAPKSLDEYLRLGEERRLKIRRMELVQKLFKRPIELWQLLDKALFLQEQNYEVSLFEFCDRNITPRNVCIQAIKKAI